jgi:hypothetical protein
MMFWAVIGIVAALAGGIYVGLGAPGMPGREDRVLPPGMKRQGLQKRHIDWLRGPRR